MQVSEHLRTCRSAFQNDLYRTTLCRRKRRLRFASLKAQRKDVKRTEQKVEVTRRRWKVYPWQSDKTFVSDPPSARKGQQTRRIKPTFSFPWLILNHIRPSEKSKSKEQKRITLFLFWRLVSKMSKSAPYIFQRNFCFVYFADFLQSKIGANFCYAWTNPL